MEFKKARMSNLNFKAVGSQSPRILQNKLLSPQKEYRKILNLSLVNKAVSKFIRFYQLFLSPLKPACCRYYPSCSQYALMQFKKNHFFIAFFKSLLRILRCNAYFKGGFDYPTIKQKRLLKKLNLKSEKISKIEFFYIPCGKDFIMIKKFKGTS